MTSRPAAPFCALLRVRLCLALAAPAFGCGLAAVRFPRTGAAATGVLLAGFAWMWWGYLPRYAASCSVSAQRGGVLLRRGVWWRRTFFLPNARTLYAERIRTPLAAVFGLEAVRYHLVGRTLTASGLSQADAALLAKEAEHDG